MHVSIHYCYITDLQKNTDPSIIAQDQIFFCSPLDKTKYQKAHEAKKIISCTDLKKNRIIIFALKCKKINKNLKNC